MKRINRLWILCLLSICILSVGYETDTASSYMLGYEANNYRLVTTPTLDGKWTTNSEWTEAQVLTLQGGLNASFRLKYDSTPSSSLITQYYLIEFYTDNTNTGGDVWSICYAASTIQNGTPLGGTTPQTDCLRIEFSGHEGLSKAKAYRGDGTGWILLTDDQWKAHVQIAESLSASPSSEIPHWTAEIEIEHQYFNIWPEMWIRIAAHDEHNEIGYQMWPPESGRDVPDDYGLSRLIEQPDPTPTASPTATPTTTVPPQSPTPPSPTPTALVTPTPSPTTGNTPAPTPTVPELPWLAALVSLAVILPILIALIRRKTRHSLQDKTQEIEKSSASALLII